MQTAPRRQLQLSQQKPSSEASPETMICAAMQANKPNLAGDPQTDTTCSNDSEHLDGQIPST
jgi:hypothetical protein